MQARETGRKVVEFRRLLALFGVIFALAASIGAISAAGQYAPAPGAKVSDIWPNGAARPDDIWPNMPVPTIGGDT